MKRRRKRWGNMRPLRAALFLFVGCAQETGTPEGYVVPSTPSSLPAPEQVVIDACDPHFGEPDHLESAPRARRAALRFFNEHTRPGDPHGLSPELETYRERFEFVRTSARRSGTATQVLIDELAARWPASVSAPRTRALDETKCYDELYLDLTEDGRYLVIVEEDTFSPVYMYWQSYRP